MREGMDGSTNNTIAMAQVEVEAKSERIRLGRKFSGKKGVRRASGDGVVAAVDAKYVSMQNSQIEEPFMPGATDVFTVRTLDLLNISRIRLWRGNPWLVRQGERSFADASQWACKELAVTNAITQRKWRTSASTGVAGLVVAWEKGFTMGAGTVDATGSPRLQSVAVAAAAAAEKATMLLSAPPISEIQVSGESATDLSIAYMIVDPAGRALEIKDGALLVSDMHGGESQQWVRLVLAIVVKCLHPLNF